MPFLWLAWLPWIACAQASAEVLGAMVEPLEAKRAGEKALADLDRICGDFAVAKRARAP